MGLLTNIEASLETQLNTVSGSPDIAWPNVMYEPSPNTLFLRPNHIPVPMMVVGISDTDSDRRDGMYQIDVFSPANGGPQAALSMADTINDLFPKGLELAVTGGFKLRVKMVSIESAQNVGTYYVVPIIVHYVTFTS